MHCLEVDIPAGVTALLCPLDHGISFALGDNLMYRRVDDMAQVENEVLRVYQQQLLEKENSGVSALLRDDKVRLHDRKSVTRRVL